MNRTVAILGLLIISSLIVLAGCNRHSTMKVGTHTVRLSRGGVEKSISYDPQATPPKFEYSGLGIDGKRLKVRVAGDKITVNGVEGMLQPGDKVLIVDDGVLINDLDFGQSERYMQANKSVPAPATTTN